MNVPNDGELRNQSNPKLKGKNGMKIVKVHCVNAKGAKASGQSITQTKPYDWEQKLGRTIFRKEAIW